MKKRIVVIGATSGIGKEIKSQLEEQGHEVISASRSDANELDITQDEPQFPEVGDQIDGLVYCPGTIQLKPFKSISTDQFREEIEINYIGAIKSIQFYEKALKKSDSASIVLFSTVAVRTGMPFHASIAGAKGAVEGLTRSLAAEFAPRIRVNALAPSLTDTPLASKLLRNDKQRESAQDRHPLKSISSPEDMAKWAVSLLEDQSRFVTGQIFAVDGGMSSLRT
jgi:NAD(P)-dependent dehydrogenase (short-subunit alcohol dehydrogenase family)